METLVPLREHRTQAEKLRNRCKKKRDFQKGKTDMRETRGEQTSSL